METAATLDLFAHDVTGQKKFRLGNVSLQSSVGEIVRGAFDHRRKTLRSSLGLIVSSDALDKVSRQFDTGRRPESFTVVEWLEIVRMVVGA